MAIQYSISYDDKGNPSLVKNTITGSRPVVNTTFNIGKLEQSREIQTNFNFVSEILNKENSNQVYKNLTNYIYEEEKGGGGQDFNPFKETEKDKFNRMDFDAAAAIDETGVATGKSTFMEKLKMNAVETYINAKLNPTEAAIAGAIPFVGSIYRATVHAGSNYVDPYYDPLHEEYYATGFGQFTDETKRRYTDSQTKFKVEQIGIDSGTGVEDPSDYIQRTNAKKVQDEFRTLQNINAQVLSGGNGGNGGSAPTPTAPTQSFASARAAMTSNQAYGGGGGGGNRSQGAGAKAGTSGGTGGRRGGAGRFR